MKKKSYIFSLCYFPKKSKILFCFKISAHDAQTNVKFAGKKFGFMKIYYSADEYLNFISVVIFCFTSLQTTFIR